MAGCVSESECWETRFDEYNEVTECVLVGKADIVDEDDVELHGAEVLSSKLGPPVRIKLAAEISAEVLCGFAIEREVSLLGYAHAVESLADGFGEGIGVDVELVIG